MPFVYLIEEEPFQPGESGPWTKIGYTANDPVWRLDANLKRGNPRVLRVASHFQFDTEQEARKVEAEAHAQFQSARHPKEWFMVSWTEVHAWLMAQGHRKAEKPISN